MDKMVQDMENDKLEITVQDLATMIYRISSSGANRAEE